jgi:hypothetical protein
MIKRVIVVFNAPDSIIVGLGEDFGFDVLMVHGQVTPDEI